MITISTRSTIAQLSSFLAFYLAKNLSEPVENISAIRYSDRLVASSKAIHLTV
jgi:hypothetical protein